MALPRPEPGQGKWWLIGGVGILLGVLLATWWGISASHGVNYNDAGHRVISDDRIEVRFDVTADTGRSVTCRIEALSADHATVGSKDFVLPPSRYGSTRHTAELRTSQRAVTGTVDSCDYTG